MLKFLFYFFNLKTLCKNYHDNNDTVHQESLGASLHFHPCAEFSDWHCGLWSKENIKGQVKIMTVPPAHTHTYIEAPKQ